MNLKPEKFDLGFSTYLDILVARDLIASERLKPS
jgi:hypothetical protein